jgi:hypothetical protein
MRGLPLHAHAACENFGFPGYRSFLLLLMVGHLLALLGSSATACMVSAHTAANGHFVTVLHNGQAPSGSNLACLVPRL